MKTKISIIGAGIAGLTTAMAIQKNNPDIELEIFERSPILKPVGAGLALAANAIQAFDQIGIKDQVLAVSNILESISIKDQNGKMITKSDNLSINHDLKTISSFSVHRAALHQVLLDQIFTVPIYLNKRTIDFSTDALGSTIVFDDGSTTRSDFIIAADGIHSVYREKLLPKSKIRYAGYTCWRGICDVQETNNEWVKSFNPKSATESWGQGKRFGIVPVTGDSIYWFACINAKRAKDSQYAAFGIKELSDAFGDFHSPINEIIKHTAPNKIIWNDIIDFEPIEQYAFDKILLIGDAAHATTPNMGQGACQAIEDAAVLGKILSTNIGIQAAFQIFQQKRMNRASTIVNRSWTLGKIAQLENPFLTQIRNLVFRMIPESFNQSQIKYLLNYQY